MISKVIAKAILFSPAGEVLLLRRSPTDDRRPGELDFPGGTVDPGEDIAQAVKREIHEEAGLDVPIKDLRLFYAKTELFPDGNVTRILFWAKVDSSDVRLSFEHDKFHWAEPAKAVEEFPHPFYGAGLAYGLEHQIFDFDT